MGLSTAEPAISANHNHQKKIPKSQIQHYIRKITLIETLTEKNLAGSMLIALPLSDNMMYPNGLDNRK